jgi:hypothetical protein
MRWVWTIVEPSGFETDSQGFKIDHEGKPSLDDLQGAVDGDIESLDIKKEYKALFEDMYRPLKFHGMFVNESARWQGLPLNTYASGFLHQKYGSFVMGNAVLVFTEDLS